MQIVTFEPDSTTKWISAGSQDTLVGTYTIGQHDSVHIMWKVGAAQTGTPVSFKVSIADERLTLTAANGTQLTYRQME